MLSPGKMTKKRPEEGWYYARFAHPYAQLYTYNTMVYTTLLKFLEGRLINDHVAHRLQPFTSGLLLVKQLPPPPDITGMQLGQHVFSEWLQRFSCNDSPASRSLDDDLCDDVSNTLKKERGGENSPDICLSTCSLNLVTHCLPSLSTWLLCPTLATASTGSLFTSRFSFTKLLSLHPAG